MYWCIMYPCSGGSRHSATGGGDNLICFPVSFVYFFVGLRQKFICKLDGKSWPDFPSGPATVRIGHNSLHKQPMHSRTCLCMTGVWIFTYVMRVTPSLALDLILPLCQSLKVFVTLCLSLYISLTQTAPFKWPTPSLVYNVWTQGTANNPRDRDRGCNRERQPQSRGNRLR